MGYGNAITVRRPIGETTSAVRDALASHGFGVLTEIDVEATLRAKLGEETPPYLILGACNPTLAHRALQAEPSLGLLLPCNVVVRATGPTETIVEFLDPTVMLAMTDNPTLADVANEAGRLLAAARAELEEALA
jgi:uncharacterized protein (DUF302 family)